VTATAIGVSLHLMTPVTAAALVAAGLVSVVIFPLVALALLRNQDSSSMTSRSTKVMSSAQGGKVSGRGV